MRRRGPRRDVTRGAVSTSSFFIFGNIFGLFMKGKGLKALLNLSFCKNYTYLIYLIIFMF